MEFNSGFKGLITKFQFILFFLFLTTDQYYKTICLKTETGKQTSVCHNLIGFILVCYT